MPSSDAASGAPNPRPPRDRPRAPRPRSRPRRLAVLGVLAVCMLGLVATAWRDTNRPRLREVTVSVPGLSRPIDVLQVTDLGSHEFGAGQSRLAALLGNRRFDTIVLTGDMLDDHNHYKPIWELVAVVQKHSSRIWYLPGNHDHPPVATGMAERGVPSLPASRTVALTSWDPSASQAALVYGRDPATIATAAGKGSALLLIAAHTPPTDPRLAAAAALSSGVKLHIAGHTHGGQIRLPFLGAIVAPLSWWYEDAPHRPMNEATFFPDLQGRMVDGMYQRDGQLVFVAQGLDSNTWGFRLGSQAEMVAYHFVPSPAAK